MLGVKQIRKELLAPRPNNLVRPFLHCDFKPAVPFEQIVLHNLRHTGHFVRGLQLNVLPWMETDFAPLWRKLKRGYPQLSLMLQVHGKLMERYTPAQIASRLRGLRIDYVLFDPSQSHGEAYHQTTMRLYVDAVYKQKLPLGIAVAGGLSGATIEHLLAPLVRDYPDLSCDAFGRLQTRTMPQRLSWPRVDAYLHAWRKSVIVPGLTTVGPL